MTTTRTALILAISTVLTCVSAAILPAASLATEVPAWHAGLAKIRITPQRPMWMEGYAARNKPAEGSVHDLYAKALALEGPQGNRFILVTMDLISVPHPLRTHVEAAVKQKYNLPPSSLMLNCSHTHCGPEIPTTDWALAGLPLERQQVATAYVETLQENLLIVIDKAMADCAPVSIAFCRARCGFAMNRRTPSPLGFKNHPNPKGPVDHDVPVLKIQHPDGRLKGAVFGYACHNTTLGFYQFCGDYAGFAQQYLEEDLAGAIAMFVLGCGADQNPYPRGTLELAKIHGRTLATSVKAALGTDSTPLAGPLKHAYSKATLEYSPPRPNVN